MCVTLNVFTFINKKATLQTNVLKVNLDLLFL